MESLDDKALSFLPLQRTSADPFVSSVWISSLLYSKGLRLQNPMGSAARGSNCHLEQAGWSLPRSSKTCFPRFHISR